MAATNTFGANRAFFNQLRKYYTWYTGGFLVFPDRARDRRAARPVAPVHRLCVPVRDDRAVRGHRHHEPHVGRRRVLRGRPTRTGVLQRHGDRRRLDERGVVYRHGRNALSLRLRRTFVRDGLDRRLLPGGVLAGSVPAQVRPVHDPGFSRRALRRQHRALDRHHFRDHLLVRLRRRADLRRRPDHESLHRDSRSKSACSSASAAFWCARCSAVCGR